MRCLLATLLLCVALPVRALEAEVPSAPVRLLPAYTERAAWAAVAKANGTDLRAVTSRAEDFAKRPMPPFPRERFLDFRRNGDRWAFEAENNAR